MSTHTDERTPLQSRFFSPQLTDRITLENLELWYAAGDDDRMAEKVAALCLRALMWVQRELAGQVPERALVFMYPNREDFAAAYGYAVDAQWMACQSVAGRHLLLLQSPRTSDRQLDHAFRADVVHEAGHIVFNQTTNNNHEDPARPRWPMWLEEGICGTIMTPHQQDPQEYHRQRWQGARQAVRQGTALALEQLTGAFSRLDDPDNPALGPRGDAAYDRSYLAVYRLTREGGRAGRNALLQQLGQAAEAENFDGVLKQSTGQTTAELNRVVEQALLATEPGAEWTWEDFCHSRRMSGP